MYTVQLQYALLPVSSTRFAGASQQSNVHRPASVCSSSRIVDEIRWRKSAKQCTPSSFSMLFFPYRRRDSLAQVSKAMYTVQLQYALLPVSSTRFAGASQQSNVHR